MQRDIRIIDLTGDDSSDEQEEKIIDVSNYGPNSEELENKPPRSHFNNSNEFLLAQLRHVTNQLKNYQASNRPTNSYSSNLSANGISRYEYRHDTQSEERRVREEEKRREQERRARKEKERKEKEQARLREEKRKEQEAKERNRFIKAVTNNNVFDGLRTIQRDKRFGISTRAAEYKGESHVLLQGDIDMVSVVKENKTAIYMGCLEEPTIIDPCSPHLVKLYDQFTRENKKKLANVTEENLLAMLKKIGQHVADVCGVDETDPDDKDDIIEKMLEESKYQQKVYVGKSNQKLIGLRLEDVMQKKGANCRFNAMYACVVLARLINEGKLPAGEVYFVQDTIRGGFGHGWTCYHTKDHLFLVDPYYDDEPTILDLSQREDRHKARKLLGKEPIDRMIDRYRDATKSENQHRLSR